MLALGHWYQHITSRAPCIAARHSAVLNTGPHALQHRFPFDAPRWPYLPALLAGTALQRHSIHRAWPPLHTDLRLYYVRFTDDVRIAAYSSRIYRWFVAFLTLTRVWCAPPVLHILAALPCLLHADTRTISCPRPPRYRAAVLLPPWRAFQTSNGSCKTHRRYLTVLQYHAQRHCCRRIRTTYYTFADLFSSSLNMFCNTHSCLSSGHYPVDEQRRTTERGPSNITCTVSLPLTLQHGFAGSGLPTGHLQRTVSTGIASRTPSVRCLFFWSCDSFQCAGAHRTVRVGYITAKHRFVATT